jgi:hypothetical protein
MTSSLSATAPSMTEPSGSAWGYFGNEAVQTPCSVCIPPLCMSCRRSCPSPCYASLNARNNYMPSIKNVTNVTVRKRSRLVGPLRCSGLHGYCFMLVVIHAGFQACQSCILRAAKSDLKQHGCRAYLISNCVDASPHSLTCVHLLIRTLQQQRIEENLTWAVLTGCVSCCAHTDLTTRGPNSLGFALIRPMTEL